MPYKEYNPKFTSEQPQVGTKCSICDKGYIEANNFTDKKGQRWYSVKCENCLTKWLSKYPPQGTPPAKIPAEITTEAMILKECQKIHDRIDKLGQYLEKKLGE